MARKGTIEESLYNGLRRKCQFKGGAHVWLDAKDNKHTRLQIRMPLSNESLQGSPEFLSSALSAMQKDDSAADYTGFDVYMLGISAVFYTSEKNRQKMVRLTACELDKFYLKKEGKGDKAVVSLHFQMDVLGHKELYDYMWDHHNNVNYIEFDFNQEDLPFEGEESDDEEGDADENED